MRERIIATGVKRLRESYPDVNADNILTDPVYLAFFKESLNQTIEQAGDYSIIGRACHKLLGDIETAGQRTEPKAPKKGKAKGG